MVRDAEFRLLTPLGPVTVRQIRFTERNISYTHKIQLLTIHRWLLGGSGQANPELGEFASLAK
jgi:hypothetical protein